MNRMNQPIKLIRFSLQPYSFVASMENSMKIPQFNNFISTNANRKCKGLFYFNIIHFLFEELKKNIYLYIVENQRLMPINFVTSIFINFCWLKNLACGLVTRVLYPFEIYWWPSKIYLHGTTNFYNMYTTW